MDNFLNLADLESALNELNTHADETNDYLNSAMSEEMNASQKRYENYIKKHEED